MTKGQLEKLLQQQHQQLFFWAKQCCQFNQTMAEEVFQIAMLKILEGKAVFQQKSEPTTWLYGVIRLTALEELRKSMKLDHIDLDNGSIGHESTLSPLWTMQDVEESAYGDFQESMLMVLPHRQREVLLLVFYHGHTLEQTASILEISIGSVRTHYERGKKKLKELIVTNKKMNHGIEN